MNTSNSALKNLRSFIFIGLTVLIPSLAKAQVNYDDWPFSMPLRLNTTASGANVANDVTNFPLLIRLNSTNFNFDQAKADGSDLRFSRNVPGASPIDLPVQMERWDKNNKWAELWVLADIVKGNNGDQAIIMHWGNLSASAPTSTQVFSPNDGFSGVWHMQDASAATATEVSQSPARNATKHSDVTPGSAASGVIGFVQAFDPTKHEWLDLGSSKNWANGATAMTLQAWVKPNSVTSGKIVGISVNGSTNSRAQIGLDNGKVLLEARSNDNESPIKQATSVASIATGVYTHIAGIIDYTNKTLTICINGVCESPVTTNFAGNAASNTNSNVAIVGAEETVATNFLDGRVDEVRISRVALSADRIKLNYQSQNTTQKLIQFQSQFLPVAGGGVYGDVDLNGYNILNCGVVVTKKWKIPAPDYVFESGYKLPSLQSTAQFIDKEKHLPGIPSAVEMEREGIDLATMNLRLLKQVEHMQLYILELEKRINHLEKVE